MKKIKNTCFGFPNRAIADVTFASASVVKAEFDGRELKSVKPLQTFDGTSPHSTSVFASALRERTQAIIRPDSALLGEDS